MARRHKVGLLGLVAAVGVGVGPLAFAANPGSIHAGSTVVAWKYTYQGGGVGNVVVLYSNNQHAALGFTGSWVSNSTTWTTLDSVAPLLAAVKHGYAYEVAGALPNGIGLHYSPNVAAALTIQNFNPAQVGGQPLFPSPSTLTSGTKSWLIQAGWGSALTSYQASHTTTTQTSTPPSSPTSKHSTAPQPTHSTAPKTTHSTTPKTSRSTQPKVSKQPVTTTTHTQHTTAPKSLPVTTKTQPVSVSPSASETTTSVPLPPKTPYLAHHHVPRSHAIVADASHPQHHGAHPSNPWPWVAGGIVVVGGAVVWIVRRRSA